MWQACIIGLMLFACLERAFGHWPLHKFRTGFAMLASSVLGHLAVMVTGDYTPILAWIVIDAAAGLIVLIRPAGTAQKAIGFLYTIMVLYHMGFALAVDGDAAKYIKAQQFMGWGQAAIFLLWGVAGVGKRIGHHYGFSRLSGTVRENKQPHR